MQLINKPDYSFVTSTFESNKVKIFFLSRHLGIPKVEVSPDLPSPPPFSLLLQISSHFPVSSKNMIFMNQVHSDEIINKTNKKPSFPTADAIITKEKNIALCLKTADCVPIFLYDEKNNVIAAVHSGWRGTALKLVKKVIKKMGHFYKTEPEDIHAFIGPAIGSCCYKVGKDVIDHFGFLGRAKGDYISRLKDGKYMLDLKAVNAHMIEQEGVLQDNVEISDMCTCCSRDLFHSYRRDGQEAGRNISFIVLT